MFSIIIPTYNRPDNLNRTVNSILSLNIKREFEIIIVNDFPGGNIQTFGDRRIRIINNPVNLGRSKSRNAGATAAVYPVLFFIDDDIEVKADIFEKHLIELENGNSAVFSNVINVRTDGAFSNLNEFLNTRGANKSNISAEVKSNYFTSAFCSIKKDFFDHIGKFDENFSGYGWEDPELGIRIEKNGGRISFVKTGSLIHYHDKSVDEWVYQIENAGANLKYLIKKHPEFANRIHYRLLVSPLGYLFFNSALSRISLSFMFYSAVRKSLK
ncbi:MAG TPA: glycosyltransferase [Clostridiales bacterium]|nr:glycosyltransferase [Clostridiales bacterium]HQP69530.1 glycosyltransferase [Clostridiales bacterium]